MKLSDAIITIRVLKDEPIIEDEKEVAYNDAVNAILDAIENGYTVVKEESCKDCVSRKDTAEEMRDWAEGFEDAEGYFDGEFVAKTIKACAEIVEKSPSVNPIKEGEE